MKHPANKLTVFLQRIIAKQNPAAYEPFIAAAFNEFRASLKQNAALPKRRKIAKHLRSLSFTLLNLVYAADENVNDAATCRFRSMLSDLYREVIEANANYLPDAALSKMLVPLPFSTLVSKISEMDVHLKLNAGDPAVYQIFSPHTTALNAEIKLPFYRWLWWQHFYSYVLIMHHDDTLMDMLIQLNFNTPEFVSVLLKHIKNDVQTAGSLADKQAMLHEYMIKYRCMKNSMPGFYAAATSLKKTLLPVLKLQLQAMQAPVYGLDAVPVHTISPATGKLATTLSVAQLAVFLRLLLDEGIISTDNQSDVFRLVSMYVQTTRTPSISADSLRNKFYSPDNAAKSIVKDQLLNLFNRLKQY